MAHPNNHTVCFVDDVPDKIGIPEWEFRVVFGKTKIDYGVEKEYLNRKDHGYSLESAVQILERMVFPVGTPTPCVVSDGFVDGGEVRHMHMSVDDSNKVVLMVTTMRPDETVRVISYRRASEAEREQYFSITGYPEHEG